MKKRDGRTIFTTSIYTAAKSFIAIYVVVSTACADQGIPIPQADHIVVVIEENRSFNQIIGNPVAPYINRLAAKSALFTNSYGITHPSQPNYLALFSGSTHGIADNRCPLTLFGENLATSLRGAGLTFGIYSESIPSDGYEGCASSSDFRYARKHNPAVNWKGVDASPAVNMAFARFPTKLRELPTISFVVPNLIHDMHDGPTAQDAIHNGDLWLEKNLDSYVKWSNANNSLLILTWDEDDGSNNNHIVTIFVGPMIKAGQYSQHIDHYDVLRTIEEMYGLHRLANTSLAKPITNIWSASHF